MKPVERLLDSLVPEHYTLKLKPNREEMRFTGTVEIKAELKKPTSIIKLHSHGLIVSEGTFSIGGGIHRFLKIVHSDNDELWLTTPSKIQGKITIALAFLSDITDTMVGMYPCRFTHKGEEKMLISTQLESHHAREVFPCIDEPAAKATFDLTLETQPEEAVISNTPIKSQVTKDSWLITEFETTPRMSTYLLALATGEMSKLEKKSKHGVSVRTWATPDNVEHTQFALDVAVRCLDFYTEYFGIPYPMAKLDNIALPDFASGAMENWGMVTYRESSLMVDPKNTSLTEKQYVALVVAHELAHQWFGDLVTMEWWTDLWLNEGFASWVEYLAVDTLFPEWDMWTQFLTDDFLRGQALDSLASSHPIEVAVDDPNEIRSIFDAISYSKGASVIRMLNSYLGPDDFQKGLSYYLNEHSYGNAITKDLWASLEHISGKPVGAFMTSWTSQTGFPVVDTEIQSTVVRMKQTRYMISPDERAKQEASPIWPIPVSSSHTDEIFTLNDASGIWQTKPEEPVKLNLNSAGFYMVNYQPEHIAKLAKLVQTGSLSVADRLSLLNDTFQLAKAGFSPTTNALRLLESYQDEDQSPVWDIIVGQLVGIRRVMEDDELRSLMKPYSAQLASKQLIRLGWDPKNNESHFDTLLRPTILGISSFADVESVVDHAIQLFAQSETPNSIHPDLRSVVYGTVVRNGAAPEFEKLLKMYRATQSSQLKTTLASALCSFKQPELIKRAQELIKSNDVKLQEVAYWLVFLFSNRHAKVSTWEWLKLNWGWLDEKFGTDIMTFSYLPKYAARTFASREFAAEYKDFFDQVNTTGIDRSVAQGIETILWQADWKNRDLQAVIAYFSPTN